MATRPFSRFKTGIKVPRGSVLKYIKGQGYTTAPAPAPKQAVQAATTPAAAPFDYQKAILGEGIYQQDAANAQSDADAAKIARDAAVKSMQFQFSDPANPYSTMGGIQRDNARAIAQINAERSARGVASSGGTTLARTDLGYDVGKRTFDATNQLNAGIGEQNALVADAARKAVLARQGAVMDASGRLVDAGVGLGQPGAAPGGGVVPGSAPGQRGGTFDFGGGAAAFNPAVGAVAAPAFDYSKIQGGYFNAAGKRVASQAAAIRANDAMARRRLTGRSY